MSQLTSRGLDNTSSAFVSDLGPCQGPDPLYVTPIQKKYKKYRLIFSKTANSRKPGKTLYIDKTLYTIHIYIFGCWQAPEPS